VRNPFAATDTLQNIVNGLATNAAPAARCRRGATPATATTTFCSPIPARVEATPPPIPPLPPRSTVTGLGDLDSMTYIKIKLKNFQEDVRLTKTFNDGKTSLTGGFYYSYFQVGNLRDRESGADRHQVFVSPT